MLAQYHGFPALQGVRDVFFGCGQNPGATEKQTPPKRVGHAARAACRAVLMLRQNRRDRPYRLDAIRHALAIG